MAEHDKPRFADLPGKPEVWIDRSTGKVYMVYMVPDQEPELPMVWWVDDEELMNEYMGGTYQDGDWTIDREFSGQAELDATGALDFGTVDEIVLRGENPFSGWASQFERQKEVLPWLSDPEVAALWASSYLEGRQPNDAELASTDWFMDKTAGEQQWVSLLWSQPETAAQLEASNRLAVTQLMEQSGISGANEASINYIADQWTKGLWTDVQRNMQIALMADPQKEGQRDQGLLEASQSSGYTTTTDQLLYVEQEARRWLGPVYGNMSDEQLETWAAKIRNDPNAKDAFQQELSRQRMSVMPGYENPDLTYEDIATPWRNFVFNSWGQNPTESDDYFQKVLQMNDSSEAAVLLRTEGLNRQIGKVEDSFVESLGRSFGADGGVRGFGN